MRAEKVGNKHIITLVNKVGYCTCGQYYHSPSARENTSVHFYNIQPYSTFTDVIIYIIHMLSLLARELQPLPK